MKKHFYALLTCLIIVMLFPLLTAGPCVAEDTVTITDMTGRNVAVPKNTSRIIAIGPGALRLICYLDARDMVAGIESFEKVRGNGRPYWIASPELKSLPPIGPGGPQQINKDPDLEAVLKVKPQVIFATCMKPATADSLQKKLGIPVVVLTYGPFPAFNEKLYESLRLAGNILGKSHRAEAVIEFVEGAKKDLKKRTDGIAPEKKPSVYIGGVGFRGLQGLESTDPTYIPLRWIGAENIAATVSSDSHLFIDREKLLQWNPDLIFIDGAGYDLIKQDFEKKPQFYKALKAFQNNRVYVIFPYIYYVANVGTAIVDAYGAGKAIYPDRFQDVDPAQKADEIYTFLVGAPVYEQMARDFGKLLSTFQELQ